MERGARGEVEGERSKKTLMGRHDKVGWNLLREGECGRRNGERKKESDEKNVREIKLGGIKRRQRRRGCDIEDEGVK